MSIPSPTPIGKPMTNDEIRAEFERLRKQIQKIDNPLAAVCELCGAEPGVEYIDLLAKGKTNTHIEGGGFRHEVHSFFGKTLGARCLEAQRRDGNID